MISVKEIQLSEKDQREEFLKIPFVASHSYHNWIPGLRFIHRQLIDPQKNPFLKRVNHHFFIAEKDGESVGRIALFGPGHWPGNEKMATIGFVDFPDDEEVYASLFLKAENKAIELGANIVTGPFNPSIHYDVGIMSKGCELSNAAFLGYNPPYYCSAFQKQGWTAAKIFQSWQLEKENYKPSEAFQRIYVRAIANPQLNLRNINIAEFDNELKLFYHLYCESFGSHWGFTVPNFEEFKFIASDLRHLLKANMGMIAEYNGIPIGFVLGVPDIYLLLKKDKSGKLFPWNWYRLLTGVKRLKAMRVMIAGLLPSHQHAGIHIAMFNTYTQHLFNKGGIERGEIGWVLKGNASMEKTLTYMGAKPVKEYVVYEKELIPQAISQ